MNSIELAGLAFLGLLLVLILLYNSLIYKRNQAAKAFASIDTYLKKRYDLIPNLVSAVKAYAAHERETLEQVTALRRQYVEADRAQGNGRTEDAKVAIENEVTDALPRLMARVEAYPEIKANEHFLRLQHTLADVEAHIAAARRFYNSAVTEYNNALEMFPTNLIAGSLGFRPRRLFKIPAHERAAVRI